MKNIVILDEYKEVDIKPSELLQKYIRLSEQDVRNMAKGKLIDCACPACSSSAKARSFEKFGLQYQECRNCHTLYISPRPDDKSLNDYYLKGEARTFWREKFAPAADKKRKEKIIKPRFQWVLESTAEYLPKAKTWADLNTNQAGYIDAMADADIFTTKILLNPYLSLTARDQERVKVIQQPWWDAGFKNELDVISLFEVVDHTADVDGLFKSIKTMLKPGGLCFITSILASGFDIQTLWDKASNLYPPDRLNCFTVDGFNTLFAKHGFECIEFSTPGILDVEIVAKAVAENPELDVSRFVKGLLESKNEETRRGFQEFLQSAQLSSYGRILLRKK